MQKIITLIILLLIGFEVVSQTKNRYGFAETYFGFETEFSPQNGRFNYVEDGEISNTNTPSTLSPRFLIGGTHFWGHADFYISIPLYDFKTNGSSKLTHSSGVLTGFRAFPWKLKSEILRPFIGIGFNAKSLRIEESALYSNPQAYFESGLSFRSAKNKVFGLSFRYFPHSSFTTAISRDEFSFTKLDPLSISVSFKTVIDFTRGYSLEPYKKFYQKLKESLAENKQLNTYSIGLGLSALIPLEKTEHASRKAFFNDEIEGNVTLDLGLAYYHHNLDAAARISYRPLRQFEEAHDYSYDLKRHSIALEAFKFIADYHGFVPFVGPYISVDYFHLKEKDLGKTVTDLHQRSMGYGLCFGWDIRLTETDFLILRTNLRYTPDLNLKEDDLSYTTKNLEFNFIQLVFYPERFKTQKKLNQ